METIVRKGFSLLEILIGLVVLGVIIATAVPLAMRQIESSQITATAQDVTAIGDAVVAFHTDNGRFPNLNDGHLRSGCQVTPTDCVANNSTFGVNDAGVGVNWPGSEGTVLSHLVSNGIGYPVWNTSQRLGWRGPYLDEDPIDPWGYSYRLYVNDAADEFRWVLGAGVNHEINTRHLDSTPQTDDIGMNLGIQR